VNIQINIQKGLTEKEKINALNVIAYSVGGWIKEYEKYPYMYNNGRNVSGTMLTRVNMFVKSNGKTMYVKVKKNNA